MQLKKAFTIIELLIIIAIIAIISSSAFASYNTLAKQQKLTNSVKQIRDVLETAKRKAVSSDGNDVCTGLTPPMLQSVGFEVYIPNSTSINLNIICTDFATGPRMVTIATYPLDSTVTVNGTPITIDFQALTGQVAVASKVVLQTDSNNIKCVTISTLGVMEELQGDSCNSPPSQ